MLRHRFQCLRCLLLLFRRFSQFLLTSFLRCLGRLLQFLIHAFSRRLNQCEAVITVTRPFPLLCIGQVLLLSILHQCLQQILNLIIHLLLLLLQLSELCFFSLRILLLLLGGIRSLQRLFLQCSHLFRRTLGQLGNRRGILCQHRASLSHGRLQIDCCRSHFRCHIIQLMPGRCQDFPTPATFGNPPPRVPRLSRPASLIQAIDDCRFDSRFPQPADRGIQCVLQQVPVPGLVNAGRAPTGPPALQLLQSSHGDQCQ